MAKKRKEKWRVRRQDSDLIDLEQQILEATAEDLEGSDDAMADMPAVKLAVTNAAAEAIDILLTDEEVPSDPADMRGLFSYELGYDEDLAPTRGIGGGS